MTRINVIPVQELHNKHLLGEYKEITRVYAITRKNQRDILGGRKVIPSSYTLGTGHVYTSVTSCSTSLSVTNS